MTKVEDSGLAKASGTIVVKQEVVDGAAMEGQADALFLAVGHGLSCRLVSGHGEQRDLPRGRLGSRRGNEGKVDLFDNAKNSLGFEWGTVKSLLNFGCESRRKSFGLKSLNNLAFSIANAHRVLLLNRCLPSLSGQTYV